MSTLHKLKSLRASGRAALARTLACAGLIALALPAQSQVLFQETFETDGEGTRYVTEGAEVFEVPRIKSEIGNQDQLGPIYWARKSKTSIVGVPGPTPARRALMYWHHTIDGSAVTPDLLALFDSTVKWLVNNKAGAKVMFAPAVNGIGDEVLRDRLVAKGYTVSDDDQAVDLPATPNVDLIIQSSNGGNVSRFVSYKVPMLTYNGPGHDDELVSTIGTTYTDLDVGDVTIATPTHAAAGGKTGSFKVVTGPATFDGIGTELPIGAVTLATFNRPSAADPNVIEKAPFLVLLESGENGGSVYGGGPFGGQEGSDFFAGSGLNKFVTDVNPKTLTFTKPIDVAGKSNLKLTMAVAGTYLDFETSDFLKVFIDPDGDGPLTHNPDAPLIHFTAPSGTDKFFNDVPTNPTKPTRLGLKFQDVTYSIPGNLSKIGIRIEAVTTWWNEIVAFDNIRVTSGDIAPQAPLKVGAERTATGLKLTYEGTLQSADSIAGPWTDVAGSTSPATITFSGAGKFYRSKK